MKKFPSLLLISLGLVLSFDLEAKSCESALQDFQIDFASLFSIEIPSKVAELINPIGQYLPPANGVHRLVNQLRSYPEKADENLFAELLKDLNAGYRVSVEDFANLPTTGSAIVVSNHPTGLYDGALMASLVGSKRQDFKIMMLDLLEPAFAGRKSLEEQIVFVSHSKTAEGNSKNRRALRECLEWLKAGHILVVFPSGGIAIPDPERKGEIIDFPWSDTITGMAKKTNSVFVPAFIHERNSYFSETLYRLHPALRRLVYVRELFNKRGKRTRIQIGAPVRLTNVPKGKEIEVLRKIVFDLRNTEKS